jgi:predicted trehalose synthase
MASDEWGKDPAVETMRKVFKQMESAQGELLQGAGISMWDPRLRRWRELSRAAFDRAWANAARRGMELGEDQAGALYAHCLARTMMREGIESTHSQQSDEAIKRLVEEVFF